MSYKFSEAECKKWVSDGKPPVNPKTKRSLDPNAEYGVYKELERQCVERNKTKTRMPAKPIENKTLAHINPSTQMNSRVHAQPSSLSSSCSLPYARSPRPIKGNIVIIEATVNPLLENVLSCLGQHCDEQREKVAAEIIELEEVYGSGFDDVQSLKEMDAHVKKVEMVLAKKNVQEFVSCGFEKCRKDMMPLVEQFTDMFEMMKERTREVVSFMRDQNVKGNDKILSNINKRIDQMDTDMSAIQETLKKKKGKKELNQILFKPIMYLQSLKAMLSIMTHMEQ